MRKLVVHAVLGRCLHDVHTRVVIALDELQLAAGQNGHVPADDAQARQRLRGTAAEGADLLPLRDGRAAKAHAGHRVQDVAVAVLVEPVGHDDAGGRVDLAEDAAAVGVVDVQTVVADAQARAKDLEALAAPYAIGRDMHIGDTIIGIKGRVGFEAAAPMLIIAAHKMLEKHTLTKWQQYWKDQVGTWYGMFLHEAQYLEPVMRDIEAFLDSSQQNVTGRVIIELHPYRYVLVGVESDYDLMKSDFGEYGEVNKAWSADDVKGFTKILGNQMKIFYSVQNKNKK